MSAPPRSEPPGMRSWDILGEGMTTAISQGMAISWETAGLWQELMRIAVDSSDIGQRPAAGQPDSALYPPLDPAPGRYVTDGGPR